MTKKAKSINKQKVFDEMLDTGSSFAQMSESWEWLISTYGFLLSVLSWVSKKVQDIGEQRMKDLLINFLNHNNMSISTLENNSNISQNKFLAMYK